jgi:hypothetical protein
MLNMPKIPKIPKDAQNAQHAQHAILHQVPNQVEIRDT